MKKAIVSKDIKIINDVNQVVKKLFHHYVIFPDGMITGHAESKLPYGIHWSTLDKDKCDTIFNLLPVNTDFPIVLDSLTVYTIYKDCKKEMTDIRIDVDGSIYIVGNIEYKIGFILTDAVDELMFNKKVYEQNMKDLKLEEMAFEASGLLMANEMVTYESGEYKIRVTKSVIPNLKKDSVIHIGFIDSNVDGLFESVITMKKDMVNSFHKYQCIKY